MPLPLYLAIAAVVFGASVIGKLPADMIGGFAAIMVLGFLLGEIGGRIPYLKSIGGSAILCLFVPSAMLGYQIMNPATSDAIKAVMKTSNFLYLYIACLVTGSMLGMNRKVLIQGFLKMFVPLAVGTIGAVVVGGSSAWPSAMSSNTPSFSSSCRSLPAELARASCRCRSPTPTFSARPSPR